MKGLTKHLVLFVAVTAVSACGGGGGGSPPPSSELPGNSIADAGPDQIVNRGETVNLNGLASIDPENGKLNYIWKQIHGPDVTGNAEQEFSGESPSFKAPNTASTIIFTLVVNDGENSEPDKIIIHAMEDKANAFFVDGDTGDDTGGDGTRSNPFASIRHAVSVVSAINEEDIYVKTLINDASYDETTAEIITDKNSSFYGGYGAGWVRDVDSNKTRVSGYQHTIQFNNIDTDLWFSGFDITGTDSAAASERTYGLIVTSGTGTLHVYDNIIKVGNVGPNTESPAPETSYGIHARLLNTLVLRNNIISSGQGGKGSNGTDGANGINGGDAVNDIGGIHPNNPILNGHDGGLGTFAANGQNGSGPCWGVGGIYNGDKNGVAGCPGSIGTEISHANVSGAGWGIIDFGIDIYLSSSGQPGSDGNDGTPGSGGGGGGSFGIFLANVTSIIMSGNTVTSNNGGDAGAGARGGVWGNGSDGAPGGLGQKLAGNGGPGGWGGRGGDGGDASGGGGGPSVGVYLGTGIAEATIDSSNNVTAGIGGRGGDSRNGDGGDGGWSYGIVNDTGGSSITIDETNITGGTGGTGGLPSGTGSNGSSGLEGMVYVF